MQTKTGDMAMEAAIAERLRARAAWAVSGLPAGARWQVCCLFYVLGGVKCK